MSITNGQTADASDFISSSAGSGSSGKVPKLNGSGLLDSSFLSFSQSEVSASRAVGSVYQNTSGHTMRVTVTVGTSSSGPNVFDAYIGATNSPATHFAGTSTNTGTNTQPMNVTFTVPNNYYYKVVATLRTDSTLQAWWEELMPY